MKILIKTLIIIMVLLLAGCYVQPRTASYGINTRASSYNNGYYNNGYYNNGGYNNDYRNGYRNSSGYQNSYSYPNRDRVVRDHRYDNDGYHSNYSGQYHQDGHNARGQYRGHR
jgi:hypothetical protein